MLYRAIFNNMDLRIKTILLVYPQLKHIQHYMSIYEKYQQLKPMCLD